MPDPAAPAASPPADGIVLGFDVGARRIGVAVGSALGGTRALAVVDVHEAGPDWKAVDRLHGEWRPHGLVVGDPMTLDGGDQPIRRYARAFANELKARYRLPVVMVDERSSSIEAAAAFRPRPRRRQPSPPRRRRAGRRRRRGDHRALA